MRYLRMIAILALSVAAGLAQTESERILSSSHIAVVVVSNIGVRRGLWDPIDAVLTKRIKGDWSFNAQFVMRAMEGSDGLTKGGKYLIFCTMVNLPDRGISLCAREQDVLAVGREGSEEIVSRISHVAAQQHDAVNTVIKDTMANPRVDNKVQRALALLFDEATQREAVRQLLTLPQDENQALAMYVYDIRPIPRNLLSPDDLTVFHSSPVADCQCIQDVVIWVLEVRTHQSFGSPTQAPLFAGRMAIADAWLYWLIAEKR